MRKIVRSKMLCAVTIVLVAILNQNAHSGSLVSKIRVLPAIPLPSAIVSPAPPPGVVASITCDNTSPRVGEEVYADSYNSTYSDATLLAKARYEWDWGDGFITGTASPYYYTSDYGRAASHFYNRPGTYTITLTVSIFAHFDTLDNPTYQILGTTSGAFTVNETITQAVTGKTAKVYGQTDSYLEVWSVQSGSDAIHLWTGATSGSTLTPSALPTQTPLSVDTDTASITVTGSDPVLQPLVTSGLQLSLNLNDDVTDASPNNLSMTWNGTPAYARGMNNDCADHTAGAYISSASTGVMNGATGLTVSLWAKVNTAGTYGTLLEKYNQFKLLTSPTRTLTATVYTTGPSGVYQLTAGGAYEADNTQWHHYAFTYDGSLITVYIDGKIILTKAATGAIKTNSSNSSFLIGRSYSGTTFPGLIDDVKVFNRALTYDDLFCQFEIQHAPFHARIDQYLKVQIPTYCRASSTASLLVTIDSGGSPTTLYTGSSLPGEVSVLLGTGALAAGNYTITGTLSINATPVETAYEYFSKTNSGNPTVGINKYNALVYGGNPVFPVGTFELSSSYVSSWAAGSYINNYNYQGAAPSTDLATAAAAWASICDTASASGILAFGPGLWNEGLRNLTFLPAGADEAHRRHFARNLDTRNMQTYVTAAARKSSLAVWTWMDEPETPGTGQRVGPAILRAWSRATEKYDPNHPLYENIGGYNYLPYYDVSGLHQGTDYDYLNSAKFLGKKSALYDIFSFDSYPLGYRTSSFYINETTRGVMDLYAQQVDQIVYWNRDLVPFFSYIEIEDLVSNDGKPGPAASQVMMEAWLNVIHGVKGIFWFHYHDANCTLNPASPGQGCSLQWGAMAQFKTQMDALAPVVLGSPGTFSVTDDANVRTNRVDTMTRDDGTNLYTFAVRITEPDPVGAEETSYPEPDSIGVTFTMTPPRTGSMEVWGESRTISVVDGVWADTFNKNAVHIYRFVAKRGTMPPPRKLRVVPPAPAAATGTQGRNNAAGYGIGTHHD